MAEQLAAGNFTGGLTVGIDAVADLLEGNAPASSALDEAPAPAGAPLPSQARPNDGDSGSGGMSNTRHSSNSAAANVLLPYLRATSRKAF